MLTIYLDTKDSAVVDETFGAALRSLRPSVPDHGFVTYSEKFLPTASSGRVILVAGQKAFGELQSRGLAPKGRSYRSLREKVFKSSAGGVYLLTHDPRDALNNPEELNQLFWDVRLANRFKVTGQLAPVIGNYKWVGSYRSMIQRIEEGYDITGKRQDISMDLETMGLDPFRKDAEIVSISFTYEPGTAEVLYTGPKFPDPVETDDPALLLEQIDWLLNSDKVSIRMANGKFDMMWLKEKWGLESSRFTFDLCLAGSLLNENRSCSLGFLTKMETSALGGYDDELNSTFDKSKFETLPPDDRYLTYAGGDTDAAQQVSTKLKDKLLNEPELARFYVNLLHPAARTFERLERRGVIVDRERYEILRQDVKKSIKENTELAMSLIPRRIRMKFQDKIEDQIAKGKSPITPEMKAEYFFGPLGLKLKPKMTTEKTGKPSTSAKHFEQYEDVPEAVAMSKALKALGQAEKVLSTYIDGFLAHLSDDGKFHASYFLHNTDGEGRGSGDDGGGTTTGRLTASGPPMQIIPKYSDWGKRIRRCFVPPEGYVYAEADYQQGELKVGACIANETNMIKAYQEGMDLHLITGSLAAHKTVEEVLGYKKSNDPALKKLMKDIRQKGKAGNFGLLFGMSAEGFQVYAKLNYGVDMTLAEATDFRQKFLYEQWPGLPKYHEKYKAIARNTGQVVSPLGRIRHLPLVNSTDGFLKSKALRQAINAPIQSTLTDMMLLSLTRLENELNNGEFYSNMVIHDAGVGYVRAKDCLSIMEDVTEIMATLPLGDFGWYPQLKFTADFSLGKDFGSMMEEAEIREYIKTNGPDWYLV